MTAGADAVGRYRVRAELDARPWRPITSATPVCDETVVAATQIDSGRPVTLRVFTTPDATLRQRLVEAGSHLPAVSADAVALPLGADADARRAWWIYPQPIATTLAAAIAARDLPPLLSDRLAGLLRIWRAAAAVQAAGHDPLDLSAHAVWIPEGDAPWLFAGIIPVALDDLDAPDRPDVTEDDTTREEATQPAFASGRRRHEVEAAAATTVATLLMRSADAHDDTVPAGEGRAGLGVRPPGDTSLSATAWDRLDHVLGRALDTSSSDTFATLTQFAAALEAALSAPDDDDDRADKETDSTDRNEPPTGSFPSAPQPVPARHPAPESLPVYDEHVQFTIYRPGSVAPSTWETLLFFAHLDALPLDAPPGTPDPLEEVARQAQALLGEASHHRPQVVDSAQPVPREGWLIVTPHAPGVEFNPPTAAFQWLESVHREEFRLRAAPALAGTTTRGTVTVFLGSIILAELPLTLRVSASPERVTPPPARDVARPYRQIFASYSHHDQHVVEEFTRYAEALGDQYLRDVVALRSGEVWQDAIADLIRRADVFQLFWSWPALRSRYVRDEWQYALSLGRSAFVRPVYWDDPLPADGDLPTAALRALHFERIQPLSMPTASQPAPAARPSPSRVPPAPHAPPPSQAPPDAETTVTAAEGAVHGSRSFPVPGARSPSAPAVRRMLRYGGTAAAALLVAVLILPLVRQQMATTSAPVDLATTDATGDADSTDGADDAVTADGADAADGGGQGQGPTALPAPPSAGPPGAFRQEVQVVTVLGPSGAPVAGVEVVVMPADDPAATPRRLVTDAMGRVEVRVTEGETYQLEVQAPSGPVRRTMTAGREAEPLIVRLPPP